jgi:hypothetical protein
MNPALPAIGEVNESLNCNPVKALVTDNRRMRSKTLTAA